MLDNFTWIDYLPKENVKISKLATGTYTQDLNYNVYYKTNKSDYKLLKENLISFRIDIKGKGPFDKAQICMGGVPLNEIDITSMKSKIKKLNWKFYLILINIREYLNN